jgi:prevent-host-death family protein
MPRDGCEHFVGSALMDARILFTVRATKGLVMASIDMDVIDVQADLERIIDDLETGRLTEVIITRAGCPVARLIPIEEQRSATTAVSDPTP